MGAHKHDVRTAGRRAEKPPPPFAGTVVYPLPFIEAPVRAPGRASGRTRQRIAIARHVVSKTNATIGRLNALHDGRVSTVWPPSVVRRDKDRPTPKNSVSVPLSLAPATVRRVASRCHEFWRWANRERGESERCERGRNPIGDTVCHNSVSSSDSSTSPVIAGTASEPRTARTAADGLACTEHAPSAALDAALRSGRLPALTTGRRLAVPATTSEETVSPAAAPSLTPNARPHSNPRVRPPAPSGAGRWSASQHDIQQLQKSPANPYAAATIVPLIASRIGMPKNPGSVPLTKHMDSEERLRYENPSQLLRAAPSGSPAVPERKQAPGRVGGEQSEYIALVRRCAAAKMWGFYAGAGPPPTVNGVFAVKKDDAADRLIIDARPANELFALPPAVALPTPDVVGELYLGAGTGRGGRGRRRVFVAKTDLSDYYHQLRLPDWMTDYFCLPPVRHCDVFGGPDTRLIYPKSLVLPMGWSHSVIAAQLVHETIVARAGLFVDAPPLSRLCDGRIDDGTPRMQVYIDDVVFYGTAEAAVQRLQDRYVAAIAAAGLTIKASKTIPARKGPPVTCVGIEVDGERLTAGVAADDLRALVADTHAMLARPLVSGHDLCSLVGSWNWAMSIQRAGMSTFQAVYGFARTLERSPSGCGKWSRSAKRELEAACDIAPLLSVSLDPHVCRTIAATDASSSGFGVCVTELQDTHEVRSVSARLVGTSALKLMAAARGSPGNDQLGEVAEGSRLRARVTLAALAQRAAVIDSDPVALPWGERELPCIAAAADAEHLIMTESSAAALRAYAPGSRIMTPAAGSHLAGFATAYERVVGCAEQVRVWRSVISGQWSQSGSSTGTGLDHTGDLTRPIANENGGVPGSPEHINCLELRTAGYAINWALRNCCSFDSRFLLLTDSTAALGALTKGRSSSFRLLRCVRRVSSVLLATGVRPIYRFVESEANPADLPSRTVLTRGSRFTRSADGSFRPVAEDGNSTDECIAATAAPRTSALRDKSRAV